MNDELKAFEPHRRELTAYAYRMLGSSFESEDAVQEAFTRAWNSYSEFEGRSSLRSWLYRITTNVCLDMLKGPQRRARPMDLSPSSTADTPVGMPAPDYVWIEPIPDALSYGADPADHVAAKESLRLAFVAAVQHLPARQRATLIMREVLRFSADETAAALEISPASVNSALQRARSTIAKIGPVATDPLDENDAEQRRLIDGYVDAFERYDMEALTSLMHEDVAMSMPPLELWVRGAREVAAFMEGQGSACRNSRLLPTAANGLPAFAHYKPSGEAGVWEPWSLTVLEIERGRIAGLNYFLDAVRLFPLFGFPTELREEG